MVRITDHPDVTSASYCGKNSKQTNKAKFISPVMVMLFHVLLEIDFDIDICKYKSTVDLNV